MNSSKGVQQRWLELVTALFFIAIGAIVVTDSFRTGFRWASDGPQPGYFPFYIGCTLIAAAGWIVFQTVRNWKSDGGNTQFSSGEQTKLVLQMFIPICVFVAAVFFLGIYVAGTIYIAAFMMWQGKFSLFKSVLVSVGVLAVLFGLFELWFQVPLPKGPIEALFGM